MPIFTWKEECTQLYYSLLMRYQNELSSLRKERQAGPMGLGTALHWWARAQAKTLGSGVLFAPGVSLLLRTSADRARKIMSVFQFVTYTCL